MDLLTGHALAQPDKPAVIDDRGGDVRTATYAELERAAAAAQAEQRDLQAEIAAGATREAQLEDLGPLRAAGAGTLIADGRCALGTWQALYLWEHRHAPQRRPLDVQTESMTFAPRYAPDGQTVVYSLSMGGNTDLYRMNINGGAPERLTVTPSQSLSCLLFQSL